MQSNRARIVSLKVTFNRLVDSSFPGFVEMELTEVDGTKQQFIEKWPVLTDKPGPPSADSFPIQGSIECELVGTEFDSNGRKIYSVSTARPHYIETIEGQALFYVFEDQISEAK